METVKRGKQIKKRAFFRKPLRAFLHVKHCHFKAFSDLSRGINTYKIYPIDSETANSLLLSGTLGKILACALSRINYYVWKCFELKYVK